MNETTTTLLPSTWRMSRQHDMQTVIAAGLIAQRRTSRVQMKISDRVIRWLRQIEYPNTKMKYFGPQPYAIGMRRRRTI